MSDATPSNILEQYEYYLVRAGKSPHTVRAYSHDMAAFARWYRQTTGEEFTPKIISSQDVTEYRSYLLRNGAKPATVNRRLIALSRFFKWAGQQKLLVDTPFDVLDRVRVRQQRTLAPRWLDRTEQLALGRAVRRSGNIRDLAIVQTFLGAGLRISELAALQVRDLDISERKGWLCVREGKGGKARDVPLDARTRAALMSYLEERRQHEIEDDQLFIGQRGPLNERGVDYLVRKYAYQAKLQECTAHTLRHTFAKNLVDSGTPLDQVATLLGHESLDTTRIYVQPSRQDLEQAVRRASGELDL